MSARGKDRFIPRSLAEFEEHRARFEGWLVSRGSEVLECTNEYEVVRFTTTTGIAVVHANRNRVITSWGNGSDEAFAAYRMGAPWRANKKQSSRAGQWKRDRIEALLKRDGDTCAFCAQPMQPDEWTLEHFVPLTCGGTNHLANMMLAHGPCNREAAHLSAREKVELIVRKRMEVRP